MKKILLVDDSALMRRVLHDIINSDGRFSVEDEATNGVEALALMQSKAYDGVVLDVNMPKMNGIELLKEMKTRGIKAKVLMASTATQEGSQITLDCLELGALDFIHKPDWSYKCKEESFQIGLLNTLEAVCDSKLQEKKAPAVNTVKIVDMVKKSSKRLSGSRIVAIAVSTGGPKALQSVIPFLPAKLDAPVVLVQHMPEGFTESFAERLNKISEIEVVEGKEGEVIKKGCVYIAKAGYHLNLVKDKNGMKIHYSQEAYREGVRPCANYMYESLSDSPYDEIVSVVMTGMGADGTEGIKNLKSSGKPTYVITQEGDSCVVNGMPRACVRAGLSDATITLNQIAQEIILRVGVKSDGC
ncbi:MAG: chemotaxis-specific protein-glutamate methyltransferase CheB [Lachnospiraceae bacterium]|nr:chemotaxis-specific protein-glutamate methyltransferase CheB [Lachnospiraceae bacterium]